MLSFLLVVLVGVLSFLAGRASARPTPRRDKRGRFIKVPPPRRFAMPTIQLPTFGPQHLAVFGAALIGVGLAMALPVALAPIAMLAPLPAGVALGRRIITPTRSNLSWSHLPLTTLDPAAKMWEDWSC